MRIYTAVVASCSPACLTDDAEQRYWISSLTSIAFHFAFISKYRQKTVDLDLLGGDLFWEDPISYQIAINWHAIFYYFVFDHIPRQKTVRTVSKKDKTSPSFV